MQFDAPLLQVLAPLMFVVGALYLLGPTLPISRPWARFLVFGTRLAGHSALSQLAHFHDGPSGRRGLV